MSKSPFQVVQESFESREKLVNQLAPMVDKLHGESDEKAVKARLFGLSNKKLLRLWSVEQTVRERFGSRDKLIDSIVEARKSAGLTHDDDFKNKLSGYSKARLLDMTKQRHPAAATKWTPEQKLASKRGKKQKARARSKLAN